MCDLKSEIESRIAALTQEKAQDDAARLIRQQEEAEKQQRVDAEKSRVANLGMEVVVLLQEHNARPRPLWRQAVIGRHVVFHETRRGGYSSEEEQVGYVEAGLGWKIYQQRIEAQDFIDANRVVGIDDSGHLFEAANNTPGWDQEDRLKRIRPGICIADYIGLDNADMELFESTGFNVVESVLDSDNFLNGVASVIAGKGPLIVTNTFR